ncbi:type I-B CRISPR-associated protein Cas7/Cst2/DevR [Amycolatopsis anabasis]|uniref:type I-B CRISPR-associated protein Cas7/Cst2/DevR n=1 Tax=Amycolatopsis anabasis TaxID=1840409 RepID=UPI001FEA2EF9|nr:type I-B CRISPR-associated protein Cas7/Cst2/DevR [Amycolatopsis anabasis]
MTYLVGQLCFDIKAGAPNNGRGEDNLAVVKKIRTNTGAYYPYASAQAQRRWTRDCLADTELASPVTRSGSGGGRKQQAHTAGRPDLYLDDDLFGYMIARAKDNGDGGSYQRDTVLAVGTAVSVVPHTPTRDFGTMSRGFESGEPPVIHEHEHYTTELASDILLDLPRVGTFALQGQGRLPDLSPAAAAEATAAGAVSVEFRQHEAIQLPLAERRRRVAVLLRTIAQLRGGAKKSLHYGERSPALVILAPIKGGNNPFTRVVRNQGGRTMFDPEVLVEELGAWQDELDGPVRIGWAPGFLGDQREQAREPGRADRQRRRAGGPPPGRADRVGGQDREG